MIYQPTYQRRLDWEQKHLERLEAKERGWQESRPCRVWTEFDMKSSKNLIWAEILKPPPADFPLILGDCLHNLRSALDNLAFELLTAYQKGRPSKRMSGESGFPIRRLENEESLKEFQKMTRGMHPEAQALIKRLQPYNRGDENSSLLNLARLHNTDKHQLPHITVVPQPDSITFFTTDLEGLQPPDLEISWEPVESRAIIGRYSPSGRHLPLGEHYTEMDMQHPPTFRLGFGERAPDVIQGWEVASTMRRIHDFISFDVAPELIRYLA